VKTDSRELFDMKCDETMVGFVQQANGYDEFQKTKMQCFYGVLDEGASLEKSLERKASKLFEEDPTSAAIATKNILSRVKNHSINSINDIEQALSISKTQVDAPKKSVYKKNESTQQLNATISVQVNVLENSTKSAAPIVETKPLTPQ
jgi:hypothetical protein